MNRYAPYPPPRRGGARAPPPDSRRLNHSRGGASDTTSELNQERASKEKPCRTLFVRNVAYSTSEREILEAFSKYGEIEKLFNRVANRGLFFVTYYDLRHARDAMMGMQGKELSGRPVDIHYSLPKESDSSAPTNGSQPEVYNNGTVFVIFRGADPVPTRNQLRDLFTRWGEVKEVRDCRGKERQKFVQFFDVRHSAKAVAEGRGLAFNGGTLIVEFARAQRLRPPHGGSGPSFAPRPSAPHSSSPSSSHFSHPSGGGQSGWDRRGSAGDAPRDGGWRPHAQGEGYAGGRPSSRPSGWDAGPRAYDRGGADGHGSRHHPGDRRHDYSHGDNRYHGHGGGDGRQDAPYHAHHHDRHSDGYDRVASEPYVPQSITHHGDLSAGGYPRPVDHYAGDVGRYGHEDRYGGGGRVERSGGAHEGRYGGGGGRPERYDDGRGRSERYGGGDVGQYAPSSSSSLAHGHYAAPLDDRAYGGDFSGSHGAEGHPPYVPDQGRYDGRGYVDDRGGRGGQGYALAADGAPQGYPPAADGARAYEDVGGARGGGGGGGVRSAYGAGDVRGGADDGRAYSGAVVGGQRGYAEAERDTGVYAGGSDHRYSSTAMGGGGGAYAEDLGNREYEPASVRMGGGGRVSYGSGGGRYAPSNRGPPGHHHASGAYGR